MSRKRKRLIEQHDAARSPVAGIAESFGFNAYTDPVNYFTAATPPQGVANPTGTPYQEAASTVQSTAADPEEDL